MKYLVMETHPGYAVVVDEKGIFKKVVNLNYESGKYVESVIEFDEQNSKQSMAQKYTKIAAIAACFCFLLIGAYVQMLLPQGTVQMKINPDVLMMINRQDKVVKMEGLNEDGRLLIEDYTYFWKDVKVVSDELADLAYEMGYLTDGGEIHIHAESKYGEWTIAMEDMLVEELHIHMGEKAVILKEIEIDDDLFEDDLEDGVTDYSVSDYGIAKEDDVVVIHPGSSDDGASDYGSNHSDDNDGDSNYGSSSSDDGVSGYDSDDSDDDDD